MNFVDKLKAFEYRVLANLDKIKCPVHLSLGQESVSDALHEILRPSDWVFSTHRNHGHYFAKGGSEDRLWDEICGLETGINKGYAGSQCFSDPEINFHASCIVGGSIGLAVGTAMAVQGTDSIVVCCIGDAATEQGVFWEALNYIVLHRLPILFVCENNGLSVGVEISERQCAPISSRVSSFGIEVGQISRLVPRFSEYQVTLEGAHCYFPKQ